MFTCPARTEVLDVFKGESTLREGSMNKLALSFAILTAAVVISAPAVFAEDKKMKVIDTEVVFVPGRSCGELPADIKDRVIGCDQVSFGKRQYAKVKLGYAPLDFQAMQTEDLAYQHGG